MEKPASLALINGKIYAFSAPGTARAVFSRGGIIEKVGTDAEILALCEPSTAVLDMRGRTVLPGFFDTYCHLMAFGRYLEIPDFSSAVTVDELIRMGREEAATPGSGWLFGGGWNLARLGEGPPTKHHLDKISDTRPIFYECIYANKGVLNSVALDMLGVKKGAELLVGVHLDEKGDPTGVMDQNTMDWILARKLPAADDTVRRRWLEAGITRLLSMGVTSIQTDDYAAFCGDVEQMVDFYIREDKNGKIPIRVGMCMHLSRHADRDVFFRAADRMREHIGMCSMESVKLRLDGTIISRTAAMTAPYDDEPENSGMLFFDNKTLDAAVEEIDRRGLQVAFDAKGDAAISQALDCVERRSNFSRPPRIIHCIAGNEEIYQRMSRMNVHASVQPAFLATDWPMVMSALGAHRARTAYALKGLVDMGVVMGGESCAPLEYPNPLEGIRAAVTRKDAQGNPEHGWIPSQRLEMSEAFWIYTGGGAKSCDCPDRGTLEPGKAMDVIVFMDDPFPQDAMDVPSVQVGMTVVDGDIKLML